ncbi:hypothetical protein ACVQ8P_06535 [Dellaglioa sp. BT-FLS60]
MERHNSGKQGWLSLTLMTSAIFAGLLAGGAMTNRNNSSHVYAQTTIEKAATIKKTVINKTIDKPTTNEKTKTSDKQTTSKTTNKQKNEEKTKSKATKADENYMAPTDADPMHTTWVDKDYVATSATEFVTQSGATDNLDEPAIYFGNVFLKFQPNELSNRRPYESKQQTNLSSWLFPSQTNQGTNANVNNAPRIDDGIIINGAVPDDRGYYDGKAVASIFSAMREGTNVGEYHLYKNTTNTGFKATMYDKEYNLSYTFEEMYDNSGGIYRYFRITNNAAETRDIGAVEGAQPFVDKQNTPVVSSAPNQGFKMTGRNHALSLSLIDPSTHAPFKKGWTNYSGGNYVQTAASNYHSIMGKGDIGTYFKNGALGTGMEDSAAETNITIYDIAHPLSIVKDAQTAYLLKANPVSLKQGETLTNGSYLTYGATSASAAPPVATATPATINAYADQTDALEITGEVSDPDSTKGHIQVTYPDKTSATTAYDTGKIDTSVDYTVNLDATKLKSGANEVTITAIDTDNNIQKVPVKVTVNLFKLGATGLPQVIKLGGTVSTDEDTLIKDLTIMNLPDPKDPKKTVDNKHTLTIDTTNPSKKPIDNKTVGFYIQDMLLTDTDVTPKETAKVPVPVNVLDDASNHDKLAAIEANDFTVIKTDKLATLSTDAINALILKKSAAKAWYLADGKSLTVKVSYTNLTKDSTRFSTGVKAIVTASYEDAGKTVTLNKHVKITVTGGPAALTHVPTSIHFGNKDGVVLPYAAETLKLRGKDDTPDDYNVTFDNPGKEDYSLYVSSSDLTSTVDKSKTLSGVVYFINAIGGRDPIDGKQSTLVFNDTTDLAKPDPINLGGTKNTVRVELAGKDKNLMNAEGSYTGQINWSMVTAP